MVLDILQKTPSQFAVLAADRPTRLTQLRMGLLQRVLSALLVVAAPISVSVVCAQDAGIVLNRIDIAGRNWSMAVDGDGVIYVAPDNPSEPTLRFDRFLNALAPFPAPTTGLLDPAFIQGVEWIASRDTLLWIETEAQCGGVFLIETDLQGAIVSFVPGPVMGNCGYADFAYDEISDTLWWNHWGEGNVFETTLDAVVTGRSFDRPDVDSGGIFRTYGGGIARIPGSDCFELPTGSRIEGKASRANRINSSGVVLSEFSVLQVSDGDPLRVWGNIWHPQGSTGLGSSYYVLFPLIGSGAAGSTQLVEVAMPLDCNPCSFAGIDNLSCAPIGGTAVELTWNAGSYDQLDLYRDGEWLGVLPGDSDSTVDDPGVFGRHHYSLVIQSQGGSCLSNECLSEVFPPVNARAPLPLGTNTATTACTVAEGIEQLLVVADDFFGVLHRFDLDLNYLGDTPVPFVSGTTTGLAYHAGRQSLFWLYQLPGPPFGVSQLSETDLDGNLLATFPIAPIAGDQLIGLTESVSGLLLTREYPAVLPGAFVYREYDLQGVPTGVVINDPIAEDLNGFGIATTADGSEYHVHTNRFSINGEVRRMSASGEEIPGCLTPIGPGTYVEAAFVSALDSTLYQGFEVHYLVGMDTGEIYRIASACGQPSLPVEFIRGDVDGNGSFNGLIDALYLLNYGFAGGAVPPCESSADVDDSGVLSALGDALFILLYQFNGGAAPPPPFTTCGSDPTVDPLLCLQGSCP